MSEVISTTCSVKSSNMYQIVGKMISAISFVFLLFWAPQGMAQEEKVLIGERTSMDFYSLGKRIDIAFTPTSNFIQSRVFYPLRIKKNNNYIHLLPTGKNRYFIGADSIGYHSHIASGGTGRISMEDGLKQYYTSTKEESYNEARAAGLPGIVENVKSKEILEQPPFKVETNLSNDTEFTVRFRDAESCTVGYQVTETDGSVYQVREQVRYGETHQIMGKEITIIPQPSADLSPSESDYKVKVSNIQMPYVIIILLLGALYFTFYFRFVNIRRFPVSIGIVRGAFKDIEDFKPVKEEEVEVRVEDGDITRTIRDEGAEGEVSHFQALSAALSATVGLGNIAGVAIAIVLGGPGATFWLIIAGLLGMSSKFVECTLGVKYREIGPDGTVHGGPMYYLKTGLAEKGMGWLGKFLAAFFAVMCVGGSLGGGNMFQANQAASQFMTQFNIQSENSGVIFGVILAILVGIVIIGGIKRIGSVAEKVVPFMAVIYVGAALIILGSNYSAIPNAFYLIVDNAFSADAAFGGFIGVLITGFQRAAFSNEAGVGSAAIAHSAVKTSFAASEGLVALLEPFIDTVVICTITALVIIVTGNYLNPDDLNGVELTSSAFESTIPGFSYVLTLAIVLFAFSTMLSWSYYGLQSWKFLFGRGKKVDMAFKIMFLGFIIVGSSASLNAVVGFSDAMIFAMVFPNIIGLIILTPVVREEIKKYLRAVRALKADRKNGN